MANRLRQRSAAAVQDEHLQAALTAVTDRRGVSMAEALAPLANVEELREAARWIRSSVVSRLPEVLGKFADNVQRSGGQVFWASTAEEANDYIAALARRKGVRTAVKSKSMASEEIHLNRALERAGVDVVETDLGEWIVQLAGETPSHITAPAIHKTRTDVAELFGKISGREMSNDPAALCEFARGELREKFLEAEMGISGVNFGIAETGSTVIVTNEGNGRMVTSLPPIHVAIMGMERVLATWEQFDVLLALLTRSATGQQITSYVTAITGSRRPGEVDGPDEFHLVILDNGRSDILGTEFQEILNCIRCGACLNVCPVYRQIGGHAYDSVYSGPVGAVLTPLLAKAEAAGELSEASSLCGACWKACPVKIPLQDLLIGLRQKKAPAAGLGQRAAWKAWAKTWSNPRSYRASVRLAALGAKVFPSRLLPRWSKGRSAPRPRGKSFRSRFDSGDLL